MNQKTLADLLRSVANGTTDVAEAVSYLRDLPYQDLGFARVDHHRALRQGSSEVIYAEGKSPSQVVEIAKAIAAKGADVLCTRASQEAWNAVREQLPKATYHARARCITLQDEPSTALGTVAIVCAGTSDLPVADEADVSTQFFGGRTLRINDAGVSGLHRLLDERKRLDDADVVIAIAGMEGALPSVIAGLISTPLVAVPTSVGYGTSFGGLTALMAILTSCSSGVTAVNIDNGFGAAAAAARILRTRLRARGA